MNRSFRGALGLLLALLLLLTTGCQTAVMASHSDRSDGMKGSFGSRNGLVRGSIRTDSGDFTLQVNTLELASGTMQLQFLDSAGKAVWQHDLTPQDAGKALQVNAGNAAPVRWVLQFTNAKNGRYDLSWGGQ